MGEQSSYLPSPSILRNLSILLVAILSTASLILFQSGFLLKRLQLNEKSSCDDVSLRSSSCWTPAQHSRVILVLIDALRFDFLSSIPLDGLPGAYLTCATADPPTTTLQRLKALGTGGLPTFIDASDNFNSEAAVEEDNLLSQLVASARNATLLGDSTWLSLYPRGFHRKFAMDSFDIHDLHGVDNYIMDHLESEVKREDYALLIAHFLGVDHAGHKYGPFHPEMAAKLRQMDGVVKNIVSWMKDDDLLIVMGDHGMTQSGDHGGESREEVGAAFLAYSPSLKFPNSSSSSSISQIDVVPTLSLLLDLPIPFSSLGSPIESLFSTQQAARNALKLTAMQVERFASTYSRRVGGVGTHIPEELPDTVDGQRELLSRIQSALRSQWTTFSLPLMRIALLSMADSIMALVTPPTTSLLIIRHSHLLLILSLLLSHSPDSSIALSLLTLSLPLSLIYSLFLFISNLSSAFSTSSCLLDFFPFVILVISYLIPFSNSLIVFEPSVLRFLLVSFLLSIFFQNQSRFLASSPSDLRVLMRSRLSLLPSLLLILILIRIEPLFHRCREEEGAWCYQHSPPLPFHSLPLDLRVFRFALSVISSSSCVLYFLRFSPSSSPSPQPPPPPLLSISDSLARPSLLLLLLYFSSSLLPPSLERHFSSHFRTVGQAVYFLSAASLFLTSLSPPSPHRPLSFLRALLIPLLLILGEGLSPSAACLLCLILLSSRLIIPPSLLAPWLSLVLPFSFYYLGHSPVLSSIPWHAAFAGISGSSVPRAIAASLVLSHLFALSILLPFLLPLLSHSPLSPLSHHAPSLMAFSLSRIFFSSLASMELRRHLMVWKIFAPHWIFGSISYLLLILSLGLSCILISRRSFT